jgi:hypothetical protein
MQLISAFLIACTKMRSLLLHRHPTGARNGSLDAELKRVCGWLSATIGLGFYWFKQEDFVSLVTMLSHGITEGILGDRHSAESRDNENVHLLSHRI